MAGQRWTAQTAAAVGTAAAAGAAQLGVGYGLGVVAWPATPADDAVWAGSLTWATWIAATSTILGAVTAARIGRSVTARTPGVILAVAAAVGAFLTVALVAVPAGEAVRPDTLISQSTATGHATFGIVIGLLLAAFAARSTAIAMNLVATTAWVWLLAAAGAGANLTTGRGGAGAYLAVWQLPGALHGQWWANLHWPGAAVMIGAAFLIGLVVTWVTVRRGHTGADAVVSGAVGPVLVAVAYLVLVPRLTGTPTLLTSAYLVAPYAVLTGLVGSIMAAGLAKTSASGAAEAPGGAAAGRASTRVRRTRASGTTRDTPSSSAVGARATGSKSPATDATAVDSGGDATGRKRKAAAAGGPSGGEADEAGAVRNGRMRAAAVRAFGTMRPRGRAADRGDEKAAAADKPAGRAEKPVAAGRGGQTLAAAEPSRRSTVTAPIDVRQPVLGPATSTKPSSTPTPGGGAADRSDERSRAAEGRRDRELAGPPTPAAGSADGTRKAARSPGGR